MEALRLLEKFEREQRQRNEKTAGALGFASWGEYARIQEERSDRLNALYHKQRGEECARLGITMEELDRRDPQNFVPDSW